MKSKLRSVDAAGAILAKTLWPLQDSKRPFESDGQKRLKSIRVDYARCDQPPNRRLSFLMPGFSGFAKPHYARVEILTRVARFDETAGQQILRLWIASQRAHAPIEPTLLKRHVSGFYENVQSIAGIGVRDGYRQLAILGFDFSHSLSPMAAFKIDGLKVSVNSWDSRLSRANPSLRAIDVYRWGG